jgi:two-component system chemotaxis sensor kinase CheA
VYGGAALLGDGRVALIASLEGIARRAGVLETGDDSGGGKATPAPGSAQAPRDPRDVHRVLLFESGPDERFALPLVQIRRLVMVDPTRIERIQEAEFLTVDGVSTRVITLNSVLSVSPAERVTPMFLLLPQFVSEPFGILASRIIDTDTLMVDLQPPPPGHPGILGSALIRDRMTLFLHLQHIREQVFGSVPQAQSRPERERSSRVLLIDDTAFFREVVRRYLEAEGWSVETAVDGHDGLARLREERFDLIICDIEMPGLDGWGVARQARELGYRLPLLALTSLSKREHEARARDCGFDEFEEKLNHDRLIATVRRMLANSGPRGGASREERP